MNAVILAGGYGSRLKPLTNEIPKPMLSVCNRPIIDYCVSQLYHFGIRDMVFTLAFMPERIIDFAKGYRGISCHFSVEDEPKGTLGSVKQAISFLEETFIVLSGDGISNIDLNKMLKQHLKTKAYATIAIKRVDNPSLYGLVEKDEGNNGLIKSFIEKPHSVTSPSHINCGVYILNKKALDYISANNCDFAKDLFPLLVKEKKLAYYEHTDYWQDIGDFKSFYNANFELLNKPFFPFVSNYNEDRFDLKPIKNNDLSLVGNNTEVDGVILNSIVGNNCIIGQGVLDSCVVLDNTTTKGRHFGCILSQNECIDVFDNISYKSEVDSIKSSFRQ